MKEEHCFRIGKEIHITFPDHRGRLIVQFSGYDIAPKALYWNKERKVEETNDYLVIFLPKMLVRVYYEADITMAEYEYR